MPKHANQSISNETCANMHIFWSDESDKVQMIALRFAFCWYIPLPNGIMNISFCYPVNQKILPIPLKNDFRLIFRLKMWYKSGQEWYISKSLRTNLHDIVRNTTVKCDVCRYYSSVKSSLRVWKNKFWENGL